MKGDNIAMRLRWFAAGAGIANKEVREALYWLQLAQESQLVVDATLEALVREADELVAILTSSIKTAKQRLVPLIREGTQGPNRE